MNKAELMDAMKYLLIICLLMGGCASPCMKKEIVLEQKQCKWEHRNKRNENILGVAGVGGLISVPLIGMCVFSNKCSSLTLPIFSMSWGMGMFAMMDMEYFMGPYPRAIRRYP